MSRARKHAEEKGFLDPDKAARVREEAASAAAEPMGSFHRKGETDAEQQLQLWRSLHHGACTTSVDDQMGADQLYREGLEPDTKTAQVF